MRSIPTCRKPDGVLGAKYYRRRKRRRGGGVRRSSCRRLRRATRGRGRAGSGRERKEERRESVGPWGTLRERRRRRSDFTALRRRRRRWKTSGHLRNVREPLEGGPLRKPLEEAGESRVQGRLERFPGR